MDAGVGATSPIRRQPKSSPSVCSNRSSQPSMTEFGDRVVMTVTSPVIGLIFPRGDFTPIRSLTVVVHSSLGSNK